MHKFPIGGGVNIIARANIDGYPVWYVYRDDGRYLPDGEPEHSFGQFEDHSEEAHARTEGDAVQCAQRLAKEVR